ncbi:PREDICTED: kinesin-like protein KIN-14J isoform X1 [Lupinus angustifolius]|uniref:kinesin-like protein KIN-14J isoform X1 n=1 Tax=Lupinus angustifolius TaxID=3871 RepID=UPI00092E8AA7|nr:PREDICTED: kinesin-like protein KIN-14J isoform X1 [Lupinus angustifolius]XP_019422621.1 PREDICTED: kinesin-like protein KIN-14J isoform X1 [Lupinus angustifolius]
MKSPSDLHIVPPRQPDSPNGISNGIKPFNTNGHFASPRVEVEAKHRFYLVQWLTSLLHSLDLPLNPTDDELRACLSNGTVLLQILNKLRPGSVNVVSESDDSLPSQSENVRTFLKALDGWGVPKFEASDLEKGSMKAIVDCLLTLRAKSLQNPLLENLSFNVGSPRWNAIESKFQRIPSSPHSGEISPSLMHHVGHKFHEVFQLKPGSYTDLPAAKISEMMKSVSLDNAPTQSLLSVVNGILEESVERRNGELPHRVACLLRKVSQEIERRISTQAEHLRTQNNLFKVREEKYQSRIRVLEALASGTRDESEIIASQLQHLRRAEKSKEEEKKVDVDVIRLMKEQEDKDIKISALKQELETTKKANEVLCSQLEAEAKGAEEELKQVSQEYEHRLEELRTKVNELEASSDSKYQKWNKKNNQFQTAMNFQFSSIQKLKSSWESIKQDIMKGKKAYAEECNQLGMNLKSLVHAAENYQVVLAENRKLFNEVQELKGNIRVYCRIRPFHPGQREKQSIVEHIGESDLHVANPSKQGKDALKSFKFNKIFGPASTQVEVYSDIQPFIRSVLDGYNVCIFAYGQTGSGKTYTMSGPTGATGEDIGVNYRALNDLFSISTNRTNSIEYVIGVQMVEIYNEQVRDLLSSDVSTKKLGILTHSQPKGLAVPDATMYPVKSPSDVIMLMDIGLKNRAISATAMNERSSRSHSVVSIQVQGKDLSSGSTMFGNLHLVDLAGSERVDRSEVTGDRLKEAQHINKSLSALGDVIFALSQKSSHVPYRNSKLTQLLQTSLGGQAKTLMFVQINSDTNSFSESLSTLKFAERVSGIELGVARSSKEGKDVRELMEQMASMKNIILKKDEEIERLQKGSVGALKQKPSSGSNKHLEADIQQPMDDHRHQNEFHHQSEIAGKVIGQTIAGADADFDERLNEIIDNGHVTGTDSDGSEDFEGTKLSVKVTQSTKSSDKMEKLKAIPKAVQVARRLGRTPSTTSIVKDSAKPSPGMKRSTSIGQLKSTTNIGQAKTSRPWQ